MADPFRITVDSARAEAFLSMKAGAVSDAMQRIFRRGSEEVAGQQKDIAKERVGQESAESGLQVPIRHTLTGRYWGSILARYDAKGATIGPNVVYSRWVESGSPGSTFRGHGVVRRSRTAALPNIRIIVREEINRTLGGNP